MTKAKGGAATARTVPPPAPRVTLDALQTLHAPARELRTARAFGKEQLGVSNNWRH